MANQRLWYLAAQTRQLIGRQAQARGLWDDAASKRINQRYLRPHHQRAEEQVVALQRHDLQLDEIDVALRDAKLHYEEAREAGQDVVSALAEAQYAISVTYDQIRSALTYENRAARLETQVVDAAGGANAAGAQFPGEHGQTGVGLTYAPLARPVGPSAGDGPLPASVIAARTGPNRVNLVDNVPQVSMTPTYDGYLDVVLHGNSSEVASNIDGSDTLFSREELADVVRSSPSWQHRPVRFMSCSVGQGSQPQNLADDLGVAVYAPNDVLWVNPHNGATAVLHGGSWQRFEPRS